MTHHPSDETLVDRVTGRLGAGPSLVVASHLATCARCRQRLTGLRSVAGVLLERAEPVAMAPGALERTLARLAPSAPAAASAAGSAGATWNEAASGAGSGAGAGSGVGKATAGEASPAPYPFELPPVLAGCSIGRWRWLAPGVRWSRVRLPVADTSHVMLLRIAAGSRLLSHTHDGIEFTQVLRGAYHDGRARYGPGDFDEADGDVNHQPVVESGAECLCLAAVDGRMVFRNPLARGLGQLVGF